MTNNDGIYYGVITLLNEERLVDRIARFMHQRGIYSTVGGCPILQDDTNETIGYFISISGDKNVVRFLEKITDMRGQGLSEVNIQTDRFGNIMIIE